MEHVFFPDFFPDFHMDFPYFWVLEVVFMQLGIENRDVEDHPRLSQSTKLKAIDGLTRESTNPMPLMG